jgi:hypothetical protein
MEDPLRGMEEKWTPRDGKRNLIFPWCEQAGLEMLTSVN